MCKLHTTCPKYWCAKEIFDVLPARTKKEFGIKDSNEYLGSGEYGAAYKINNKQALKISVHQEEYNVASLLINYKLKNVAKYYATKKIKIKKKTYYLIKMELLNNIPEKEHDELKKAIYRVQDFEDKILKTKPKDVLCKKIFSTLNKLSSIGIKHTDLHPGNILFDKSNNFKLIDIM